MSMSNKEVRHPEIEVELVGHDGNAYSIMGRVSDALRKAGVPTAEIDEYLAESMSGDYDHLLATAASWVEVS